MQFYGDFLQIQRAGNFLVGFAPAQARQHLLFTVGQVVRQRVLVSKRPRFVDSLLTRMSSLDYRVRLIQSSGERLPQKLIHPEYVRLFRRLTRTVAEVERWWSHRR